MSSEDAAFVWADHETLEELLVEVSGTPSFLRQLEELGFERLPTPGHGGGGASAPASSGGRRVLMDIRGTPRSQD